MREGPAGEDSCKLGYVGLIIGGGREAIGAELHRAILIQQHGADGEKLHELARIIFIRYGAERRIRGGIVHHIEKSAHRGTERDIA